MAKQTALRRWIVCWTSGGLLLALGLGQVAAQEAGPNLNFFGVTGAIDTPTADVHADGDVTTTISNFAGITRTTLSFQMLPRVQGSFRYTAFAGLDFPNGDFEDYYDRSFDISILLLKESEYLPAIKVGFQDFVGTGLFSGEYLVATKHFLNQRLKVSAGLGWGRLAGINQIGSPFGDRNGTVVDTGGTFNTDIFFRGPAAPFGSVIFQATDRLSLLAEFSSDNYTTEQGSDTPPTSDQLFERRSSFNFGANVELIEGVNLGAYYLYGSAFGVNLNFTLNPYRPPVKGSTGPAPGQIAPRPERAGNDAAYSTAWARDKRAEPALVKAVAAQLEAQGLVLVSLDTDGSEVTVKFRNLTFDATAQAVGRVARTLTRTMPASVEVFRIVPEQQGLSLSEVRLRRSDVEGLVNQPDDADQLLATAGFADGPLTQGDATLNPDLFPKLDYYIGPYIRRSLFDPAQPLRLGIGIRARGSLEVMPGLVFSGSVAYRFAGNIEDNDRESDSVLPNVRTSFPLYDQNGNPALENLTAAYFFRPGENLYARVTGGYLERMFGGISGEILWKPVSSRLGLGLELNYARQRDPDLGFAFANGSDGVPAYDVITGHVSAYYQFDNGYHAQVDVGRYLAGDFGATLTVDRTFRNGWSLGAFATMTDVSFDDFGEGSFDKGIRLTIPVSFFTSKPTRRRFSTVIRPVQRDGGARLFVPGRLYGRVRDYDQYGLEEQWGRVWR